MSPAPGAGGYAGFTPAGSEQAPRVLPTLAASPPTPQPFKSGWQVDQFTWPRLCRRLIARAAGELDRLADALMAANMQGQKVLAVAGYHRGEALPPCCFSPPVGWRRRGIKPVLVDADLAQPRLAKRLGVQPQFGWDETEEEEGRSLDQAIVEATANNVALLPAREPVGQGPPTRRRSARLPVCLGILREHYDMVLVDLGPLEEAESAQDAMRRTAPPGRCRRAGPQPSPHVGRTSGGMPGTVGRSGNRRGGNRRELRGRGLTPQPCGAARLCMKPIGN